MAILLLLRAVGKSILFLSSDAKPLCHILWSDSVKICTNDDQLFQGHSGGIISKQIVDIKICMFQE